MKILLAMKNKSIVYTRQTANALESLYHLDVKKKFGDKSEFNYTYYISSG